MSVQVGIANQDSGSQYELVFDNSGPNNQPLYEGSAQPGTSDGSGTTKWRIRKFLFDANNIIYGWRWANGTREFDKDWTLRTSYTYASL